MTNPRSQMGESKMTDQEISGSLLKKIGQITQVLGVVATAAAAVFASAEYFSNTQQEKVNRTFSYFADYRSIEMITVRSNLNAVLSDLDSMKDSTLANEEKIDKMMKQPHLLHYDTVVSFFDTVYLCIETGGCDRITATRLFLGEAQQLLSSVRPAVEYKTEGNAHHAIGLRCLAANYEDAIC